MADHSITRLGTCSSDRMEALSRRACRPAHSERHSRSPLAGSCHVAGMFEKGEAARLRPPSPSRWRQRKPRRSSAKSPTDAVIYPLRQAALTPKISAPVRKFFVERGSHVHAGELLAQLEDQDLAAAVTDNKGAYEQAEAAYETATKQSLPEEIQKAELDTKAAQEAMQSAQKVYRGPAESFQARRHGTQERGRCQPRLYPGPQSI